MHAALSTWKIRFHRAVAYDTFITHYLLVLIFILLIIKSWCSIDMVS